MKIAKPTVMNVKTDILIDFEDQIKKLIDKKSVFRQTMLKIVLYMKKIKNDVDIYINTPIDDYFLKEYVKFFGGNLRMLFCEFIPKNNLILKFSNIKLMKNTLMIPTVEFLETILSTKIIQRYGSIETQCFSSLQLKYDDNMNINKRISYHKFK